ncbi:MAG: DUF420 domain-containing protein [Chloroflexi bacterium]|nr:DUF420 domain-containing protein [Chloroflexota bacterium]
MSDLLQSPGFLGTKAQFGSDATLVLILVTAVLFTIGWRLAAARRYEAHRWVQTLSAALNAVVVVSVMIGSFLTHILPGLPGKLLEGSYGVTTVHAFVGLIGLLLGVFVVLRGNKLVPHTLCFANYKAFMRVSYALYMAATLIGVVVYGVAFVYGI